MQIKSIRHSAPPLKEASEVHGFRDLISSSLSNPSAPKALLAGQSILSMGSCFADAFGRQMERLGMPVSINPFGITFDAYSIERQLGYLSGNPLPQDVFEHLNLWRHFDCHGSLSHPDPICL